MPNIVEYTNQHDTLQPQEIGVEAYAQEGRRVGAFYQQMAQDTRRDTSELANTVKTGADIYEQHVTTQEIGRQNAVHAQLQLDLTQKWNQTVADATANGKGDDPSLAATCRASVVERALANFQKGYSTEAGKSYGQQLSNGLRQHFYEKTATDTAAASADAAVQNKQLVANGLDSASRIDPGSTQYNIAAMRASTESDIATHGGSWSPEQQAMYRKGSEAQITSIALGHYQGLTEQLFNPDGTPTNKPQQALAEINDPKNGMNQYLPEGSSSSIVRTAQEAIKQQAEGVKAAAVAQTKAQKDQAEHVALQIMAGASDPKTGLPTDSPQARQALMQYSQLPGADVSRYDSMRAALDTAREHQANGTFVISDSATKENLISRLDAPTGSSNYISDMELEKKFTAGLLSPEHKTDIRDSRERAANTPGESNVRAQINTLLANVKPTITHSDPTGKIVDYAGDQAYGQFYSAFWKKYDAGRAAGKTPEEIRDTMFDAKNPHNAYRQAAGYSLTQKQTMSYMDRIGGNKGPAVVPAMNNPDLQFYSNGGWGKSQVGLGGPSGSPATSDSLKKLNQDMLHALNHKK